MAQPRKIQRAPVEIFNLSFLDIISCAFGAVVMLVLLAKNGEEGRDQGSDNISNLIERVLMALGDVEALKQSELQKQQELAAMEQTSASVTEDNKNLETALPRAQQTLQQLRDKAASLRAEVRQATAMLNADKPTDKADDEVGGIPTDAEYVVFVIDNSGSMSGRASWERVMNVVDDILQSHPQMKGFQIMAAGGQFMFSSQRGKWLVDRPSMRRTAMDQLRNFKGGASQPEAGINIAIDYYKNTEGTVSLYVFGDDYRPSNLDQIVSGITRKNSDANGNPIIRIHGIGFNRSGGDPQRFAAFMQALAKRNNGAFVGLNF